MNPSPDRLLAELEQHMLRVIQHPVPNSLDVSDNRGTLAAALASYIDARVDQRIEKKLNEITARFPIR
jgi:hypothetical protein